MEDIVLTNANWKEAVDGMAVLDCVTNCFVGMEMIKQSHLTDSGANPVLTVNAESGILQVVLIKLSNSVNLVDT